MAPVHAAGQLQGCALKHLDERALFFSEAKQNLAFASLGKAAWQGKSCLARLELLKQQLGVSSAVLAKPTLKT